MIKTYKRRQTIHGQQAHTHIHTLRETEREAQAPLKSKGALYRFVCYWCDDMCCVFVCCIQCMPTVILDAYIYYRMIVIGFSIIPFWLCVSAQSVMMSLIYHRQILVWSKIEMKRPIIINEMVLRFNKWHNVARYVWGHYFYIQNECVCLCFSGFVCIWLIGRWDLVFWSGKERNEETVTESSQATKYHVA